MKWNERTDKQKIHLLKMENQKLDRKIKKLENQMLIVQSDIKSPRDNFLGRGSLYLLPRQALGTHLDRPVRP